MRHWYVRFAIAVAVMVALSPGTSQADVVTRNISGSCDNGEPVSFKVTIAFTPTGGDFGAGTGTAEVAFTLENTSGLVPFEVPANGNGVLTRFRFNAPATSNVVLIDVAVLAGSFIESRGVVIGGEFVPVGCFPVVTDEVHSNWYEVDFSGATGGMVFLRNNFETEDSKDGGLLDPSVVVGCVEQGDFFPQLAIAGQLRFRVTLDNLDNTFISAGDFIGLCSVPPEGQELEAFSGKFQDVGPDNVPNRCRIFDFGLCTIPVEETTWGAIKELYGGEE